jgi:hypothetical protein
MTKSGHDAIVVFVDKLGKLNHFVATTTNVTAPKLASIVMHDIVRLHGVPDYILSDRDPRFTAHFWRELWAQLGTTLTMSTSYHPQTDGQTERANRTLEEMLRAYVHHNQKDWDEKLDLAELAINNAKQASTGFSAFELSSGFDARLPLDQAIAGLMPMKNPTVIDRIRQMKLNLDQARSCIESSQKRQSEYANQHRRHITFAVGDQVLLSTEHLKMIGDDKRTPKLTFKYIGPFKVKRIVNKNAYELELPPQLRIHPVLNIGRLKEYKDGSLQFPSRPSIDSRPPPDVAENGSELFEVESIIGHRGIGTRASYLVKWKGYPLTESTWEKSSAFVGDRQVLTDYLRLH